jgi:hypothetical protein
MENNLEELNSKKYLNIVSAEEQTLKPVYEYLETTQKHTTGRETLFIPAALGAVVDHKGNTFVFSAYRILEQFKNIHYVYDLHNRKTNFVNITTSQVLKCGVTASKIGNFKLLAHGASPTSLATLTARGIALINQISEISNPINFSLYYNKSRVYPAYSKGETSYKNHLLYMAQEENLDIEIVEQNVCKYDYMTI